MLERNYGCLDHSVGKRNSEGAGPSAPPLPTLHPLPPWIEEGRGGGGSRGASTLTISVLFYPLTSHNFFQASRVSFNATTTSLTQNVPSPYYWSTDDHDTR